MGLKFNPTTGQLDLAGGDFVKRSGDTMTGALGIGTSAPRSNKWLDIYDPTVNTVGAVTSATLTFNYGGPHANNYFNDGYSFEFRIKAYKTIGASRVYSSTYYTLTGTDSNTSSSYYSVDLSWPAISGAEGYKIAVSDSWYGTDVASWYFEVTSNVATIDGGNIIETGLAYVNEVPVVFTPTSLTTGADWYVDTSGNMASTNNISGLVLESTATTGTAPLIISSTTKVTGLNVDQIDGTDTSTDGTLASNSDALIPTQKAVKTYVDASTSPFQYVTRTMAGSPAGEYADIGYWTTTYGAHNLRVSLTLNINGAVLAKQYLISTTYNQTAGAWQLVPANRNTGYYNYDFHLIAYQNNANLQFRIVCFRNNNAGTLAFKVRMENCGDSAATFTSVATSGTMTVPNALVTSSTDYHQIGGGYMFTRAIPASVGSYIEMCSLNGVNGNGATEMWVSNVDNGFVVSKRYIVPGTYNYAPNWCILAPISETGDYGGNDFQIVAQQNSTSISLRLLKTLGGGTGTAIITLSSGGDYASFFNESSGTGTMSVPTIYHPGTSVTQWKNNTAIRGSLHLVYLALTSARTLDATDYLVNCTSGTFAVTLPTAVGYPGKIYNIKNSGTGVITPLTTSSQTIDGNMTTNGTLALNQYDEIEIMSNGANWITTNRRINASNIVSYEENPIYYNDEVVYL